jgi:hypothetical protein
MAMAPDFIQLGQKVVVVLDVSELPIALAVLFERPIRRRGHDEMDTMVREKTQISRVVTDEVMRGRDFMQPSRDRGRQSRIACDAREIGLMIGERPYVRREKTL